MKFTVWWCLALFGTAVMSGAALAESTYPERPITVIVSYPAGGTADIATRIVAEALGDTLSVPVVVENRPGGSGSIGTAAASRAKADGYTLLSASSEISLAATGRTAVPPTVLDDLTPLAQVATAPVVLVARSDTNKSMLQWAALAKERPGQITYATPGVSTSMHLVMASLMSKSKIPFLDIPYNGGGRALIDLIGGQIDLVAVALGTALPQINANKVMPLAVLQPQRSRLLPEVPTMSEAIALSLGDIPLTWFGWFAPSQTPAAIQGKLSVALRQVLASEPVRARLTQAGLDPRYLAADEFKSALGSEVGFYSDASKLIRNEK